MTYPFCTCCGTDLSSIGKPDQPGSTLHVVTRRATATRFTSDITEPINYGIDAEYFCCSAACWEKSKGRLLEDEYQFTPLPEEWAKRRITSCSRCGGELKRDAVHISYDLEIGKNRGAGSTMMLDTEATVELGVVCRECEEPTLRTDKWRNAHLLKSHFPNQQERTASFVPSEDAPHPKVPPLPDSFFSDLAEDTSPHV